MISPEIKCGQETFCSCHVNQTNAVTISVAKGNISYGSHTFERGGEPYIILGQLELHMVKAIADSANPLLTIFEINVRDKSGNPFNLTCSDASTKYIRHVVPSNFSSKGFLHILKCILFL